MWEVHNFWCKRIKDINLDQYFSVDFYMELHGLLTVLLFFEFHYKASMSNICNNTNFHYPYSPVLIQENTVSDKPYSRIFYVVRVTILMTN